MAKPRKSFLLRVDPRVHDALKRWADAEFRSLNGQVEYLLRQVLVEKGRLNDAEIEAEPPRPGRPPAE